MFARILEINRLEQVTKELVKAVPESLVIGLAPTSTNDGLSERPAGRVVGESAFHAQEATRVSIAGKS